MCIEFLNLQPILQGMHGFKVSGAIGLGSANEPHHVGGRPQQLHAFGNFTLPVGSHQ